MRYDAQWERQRGIAVSVYRGRSGVWRLRDANGDMVMDEFGEGYAYVSQADAEHALATFVVE